MKSKEITITIKGIQHDISEECIENTYTGQYAMISGKHIIKYDEYPEEENTTKATNKNLVKINDNRIQITKKGAVNTQMCFEQGKKHHGVYQTPFGNFDMMLETEHIAIKETPHTIHADITYFLSLNNSPVSKCTIQIQITGQ